MVRLTPKVHRWSSEHVAAVTNVYRLAATYRPGEYTATMEEIHIQGAPLFGLAWNEIVNAEEAPAGERLDRGLLIVFAFHDEKVVPIGTGFIISSANSRAVAASAAHVFSEIRALQSPPSRSARSALAEFLPPVQQVDIDRRKVRVIIPSAEQTEINFIDGLAFDEATDIALMSLAAQDGSSSVFPQEFLLDDQVPEVGDLVAILSYGNLALEATGPTSSDHTLHLAYRPVLRVGKVLSVHREGTRLCRGPCIETSIPVYSGMSGGPVFHFDGGAGPMRVFGVVCSDPDPDPDTAAKQDRSIAGRSIVAVLPTKVEHGPNGKEFVLRLSDTQVAGSFASK